MSTITLRCPACKEQCHDGDIRHEDYLAITACCDEIAERVFWCETCGEREAHAGCTECLECVADEFVANPADFIGTAALKAEIADELARRLKPFMRQRQAA